MDRERDELRLEDLTWGESGLLPAIVQEAHSGEVLMLAWMDREALARTLGSGRTWLWSRSRQAYWMKGETSGNVQDVIEVRYDCDADALLVRVVQHGDGACHTGARTCFYRTLNAEDGRDVSETPSADEHTTATTAAPSTRSLGEVLEELAAVLAQRHREQPEGSYTVKLLTGPQDKLLKKIAEEAGEVIIAARDHDVAQTRYEIADLFYHLLVVMEREGVSPSDLAAELASRRR
jgi:phosphoribosyl-ATP pyrophosphohydrolase/phosphoribosyl-AMP cyclohydrolase